MKPKRIILTVKDIQIITGKSYKSAYTEMGIIRAILEKKKECKVTIKEYADYYDLKVVDIYEVIE